VTGGVTWDVLIRPRRLKAARIGARRWRAEATTCSVMGTRRRPEATARARGGRASPAAGGGAKRCVGGGRWPAVA
jgi:hypothetical protein